MNTDYFFVADLHYYNEALLLSVRIPHKAVRSRAKKSGCGKGKAVLRTSSSLPCARRVGVE